MGDYRNQFNVNAAHTAIRQDFQGNAEYITGMGGQSLNITADPAADPALKADGYDM